MTRSQRKYYLVLHAVREMALGMQETGQLDDESQCLIERILGLASSEIDAIPPMTPADARAFIRVADTLRGEWQDDEKLSRQAFVCIALTSIADFRASLPPKAVLVGSACRDMESIIFELYRRFDDDLTDCEAMDQGERISNEYRAVVACV